MTPAGRGAAWRRQGLPNRGLERGGRIGVFLHRWWKTERPEDGLVERLERLRTRIMALDANEVSEVIRVEPVCNPLFIDLAQEAGATLPKVVEEALDRRTPPGKAHGSWCIRLDPIFGEDHFT